MPVERARSCYCEFDFHCDRDDPDEVQRVNRLWLAANELCTGMGAVLDKPYGACAEMVYRRYDPSYVALLRSLKKELDPNNIMNPGQLCF